MIKIENLSKSFGDKILMDSINYHFPAGEKIALVGDNGAGKTTFLNIITKTETAGSGSITQPEKLSIAFLPQVPNPTPESTILNECIAGNTVIKSLKERMDQALLKMEQEPENSKHIHSFESAESSYLSAGGYGVAAKASLILSGLGFEQSIFDTSPKSLSGGWRMRLELAKIFLNEPDFLILDEPTNHLDLPSLVWVENFLRSFRGTILFVSHDKTLLNTLSTITLHLQSGKLVAYKGNYDNFLSERSLRIIHEQSTLSQLKKRREDLDHFVKKFGAKATKAKQAQARVKMIEKIKTEEENFQTTTIDKRKITFHLPEPEKSDRIIYKIEKGSIGYQKALSQGIDLQIERGQKVAIIGANGIGKSTLLKTIVNKVQPLRGSFDPGPRTVISYFAQDQLETLDSESSILDNLKQNSQLNEKEIRSLLASFLFQGDDIFKLVKVLSGGEKSRVGLACILSQKSNFHIYDEPTNHLDMKSSESLIDSIKLYQGTVLFVSHDRELINKVCTHVFAMLPDGRSQLFEGNLEDYVRLSSLSGFPNVLELSHSLDQKPVDKTTKVLDEQDEHLNFKSLKKRRNQLTHKISKLEKEIDNTKDKITKLEDQMTLTDHSDFKKHQDLHNLQTSLQSQLDIDENEWLGLHDELEKIEGFLQDLGRS